MSDLSFQPDEGEIERRVEALLFAAAAPLSAGDLARRLPEGTDVSAALMALKARYADRGVRLECVADRWRFATAAMALAQLRLAKPAVSPSLGTRMPKLTGWFCSPMNCQGA